MIRMRMPASRDTIGWRCAMLRVMLRALLMQKKLAEDDSTSKVFAPDIIADGANSSDNQTCLPRRLLDFHRAPWWKTMSKSLIRVSLGS